MALSYSDVRDAIESDLRDGSNTYHATEEIDYKIVQGLRELAKYDKHLVRVTYQIESRYGTATSGTTTATLEDATKDQFEAADDDNEKVIHNTTDNTWAVVLTYTDAENFVLSADIMASGENYEIYNKGCWNSKQINIEDVADYLWVERVEYPIGTERSFEIHGDILEIGMDVEPDDSDPANTDRVIDVYVWFAKPHKLCQLTTGTGELTANQSKGDVRIAVDGLLPATGVVEIGDEFHLENHRTLYTIIRAVTLIGGAEDIDFYPPLEANATENDDITFTKSTLKPQLESLLIEYVVAKSLMDEANIHLPNISTGGTGTYKRYLEAASYRYDRVIRQLEGLVESKPAKVLPRS